MNSLVYYGVRLLLLPCLIIIIQFFNLIKTIFEVSSSIFLDKRKPLVVRTPEECFKCCESLGYIFKPNYVELSIGGSKKLPRVHYIDEGPRDAKETILCLHGVLSWSFLYRKIIPPLVSAGYRVVAPDFIGFGKSDKITFPESYTHDLHKLTLRLLIDHLKLDNITLVCQDWGGQTGLPVVMEGPDAFSRLVIMNTGLPCGSKKIYHPKVFAGFTPFLLWRSIVQLLHTRLPIKKLFKQNLKKSTPEILNAYVAPFPSPMYKAGAAQWPLLVPVTANTPVASDLKATQDFLSTNWKKPALIMFSDQDPITWSSKAMFERLLPHAKRKTVIGGGHFLQEDKGEEIANNIIAFINNKI